MIGFQLDFRHRYQLIKITLMGAPVAKFWQFVDTEPIDDSVAGQSLAVWNPTVHSTLLGHTYSVPWCGMEDIHQWNQQLQHWVQIILDSDVRHTIRQQLLDRFKQKLRAVAPYAKLKVEFRYLIALSVFADGLGLEGISAYLNLHLLAAEDLLADAINWQTQTIMKKGLKTKHGPLIQPRGSNPITPNGGKSSEPFRGRSGSCPH